MAQYLLTCYPVKMTSYQLQYAVEAESPEEAERIFREQQSEHRGRIQLVHQERVTSTASRAEVAVTIEQVTTSAPPASEMVEPTAQHPD